MTSIKVFAFAIGIAFAASSFAVAQQGSPSNQPGSPPSQQSNPPNNAAASGSSSAHQTTARTGTAANRQQIQHRRLAARPARRVTVVRHPRRLFAYQMSPRCRRLLRSGRPLPRSCR
jgi:hypothetical protein